MLRSMLHLVTPRNEYNENIHIYQVDIKNITGQNQSTFPVWITIQHQCHLVTHTYNSPELDRVGCDSVT